MTLRWVPVATRRRAHSVETMCFSSYYSIGKREILQAHFWDFHTSPGASVYRKTEIRDRHIGFGITPVPMAVPFSLWSTPEPRGQAPLELFRAADDILWLATEWLPYCWLAFLLESCQSSVLRSSNQCRADALRNKHNQPWHRQSNRKHFAQRPVFRHTWQRSAACE